MAEWKDDLDPALLRQFRGRTWYGSVNVVQADEVPEREVWLTRDPVRILVRSVPLFVFQVWCAEQVREARAVIDRILRRPETASQTVLGVLVTPQTPEENRHGS